MWRRRFATALRERNLSVQQKRFRHDVVGLQLDYYMSSQFAGVANAIVHNLYSEAGIDLVILPTCPVGTEQARVRQHQDEHPKAVSIGSVEQNVFFPTIRAHPELKTTAVAAMLDKSPLAVASLKQSVREIQTIGAHEDMVELFKRIFPSTTVVASPRGTKNTDLLHGKYDGIQVYNTTEVPTLRLKNPHVTCLELEGFAGIRLGYSQMLFAADECLQDNDDRRQVVQAFLQATFAGWEISIKSNPADTLAAVQEVRVMLQLDDEDNDHWDDRVATEMLQSINTRVKLTGDKFGVIDEKRWNDANKWLSKGQQVKPGFALDTSIWQARHMQMEDNPINCNEKRKMRSVSH